MTHNEVDSLLAQESKLSLKKVSSSKAHKKKKKKKEQKRKMEEYEGWNTARQQPPYLS